MDMNRLGSDDVEVAISDIKKSDGYVHFLPSPESLAFEPIRAKNVKIANRRFSEVLLARLLIFRLFLEIIQESGESLTEDHRRRWLTLQLHPSLVLLKHDMNLFVVLSVYLRGATDTYIQDTISNELDGIRAVWSTLSDTPPHLFIALDEANVSSAKLSNGPFGDKQVTFSVLNEILRAWRERMEGFPVRFVVAGTQIPKRYFLQDEWNTFVWSSDTGAFDERALQEQYILQFLPREVAESPSGKDLVRRMWDWCRTR